jgi:transcriptional regulator with XRE-family HTH domain
MEMKNPNDDRPDAESMGPSSEHDQAPKTNDRDATARADKDDSEDAGQLASTIDLDDEEAEAALVDILADMCGRDLKYVDREYGAALDLPVADFVPQSLLELLTMRDFTVETFALEIHLSADLVEKVSHGEIRLIPNRFFQRVAGSLNVPEDELRKRLIDDAAFINAERISRWAQRDGIDPTQAAVRMYYAREFSDAIQSDSAMPDTWKSEWLESGSQSATPG